jgi:hypothetical protein
MSDADPLRNLLDDYLDGQLDEDRLRQLEERLRADPGRRLFVRYARLHTDLQLDVQAQRAGRRALGQIEQITPPPRTGFLRRTIVRRGLLAAAVLLALATGWWFAAARTDGNQAVAWLVNAQDCTWADGEPDGDLRAGKLLKIERGLAEVRFECGAVVLEGPASLELLSVRSACCARKLTARVPGAAAGSSCSPRRAASPISARSSACR